MNGTVLSLGSFYLLSGLTCLFALMVVTSRNVFHSAIYLAFTLIGVAGIYLFLDAEFLAAAQILIYVGAIVTLFVFSVMLTTKTRRPLQRGRYLLVTGGVSFLLLIFLINIILKSPLKEGEPSETTLGVEELGRALMSVYALPFEIISVILMIALIGAVVIGKVRK